MDTSEDFDINELNRLIEDALEDSGVLHASFLDMEILEKLYDILPKYLSSSDVSYLIGDIREDVYASYRIPTPQKLHNLIKHCTKCSDELDPAPVVPSWNIADPDLLIVGLNPQVVTQYADLLTSTLSEAGFSGQRCCLTYVTRCPTYKPSGACVANCSSFLHTEIHSLKPKLICTLGLEAYIAITGDSRSKIKDVAGKIKWLGMFPILPLYSLGYIQTQMNQSTYGLDQFKESMKIAYDFIYGG